MLFNNDQLALSHDIGKHVQAHNQMQEGPCGSSDQNRTQSQEEIIRITVDLGNNRTENIIVLKGQEKKSHELAQEFCIKHGFQNIQAALAKQIQMNIDQILQNSSSNSYLNDDFKSSNSPEQFVKDEKENDEANQRSFRVEAEKAEQVREGENQEVQTNMKTNTESITHSGRGEEEVRPMQVQQLAAVNNEGKQAKRKHSKSFSSNAHRNQMSHFDVIHNQISNNQLYHPVAMQDPPEPVSAAVRAPNNFDNGSRNEMDQVVSNQPREKGAEVPVSDLVSYEGGPSNLLNDKLTDHSNYFSNNSHEQVQSVNGPTAEELEREINEVNLDQKLINLPSQKLNIHLMNPECRSKPEINEISRILAAGKRSNEPIHERLYKHETLSKKIAVQLKQNEKLGTDNVLKRSKSSEQQKKQNQGKQHNKSHNESVTDGKSIPRVRSANRFRNDEKIDQIPNPGARLYQRGIQMEQEKKRLIEQARLEMEQTELNNHCTFQPKLITQSYYTSQQIKNILMRGDPENNEENLNFGLTNEFNDESAQKKKRPAVSIEKMIIKDGETIHLNRAHSPKLMSHNQQMQIQGAQQLLQQSFSMIRNMPSQNPFAGSYGNRDQIAKSTSERLLNYGKQIHLKRQIQQEEQLAQQEASFDFKPKINNRSRSLANQKRNLQKPKKQESQQQVPAGEDGRRENATSDLINNSQMIHNDGLKEPNSSNPYFTQGRNVAMSNYFSHHMNDNFQPVHQSELVDQSNLQDEGNDEFNDNCGMMADEMSQPAPSNIFNDKSFSNQTNYYVGNPTQMPGGDDDDIIEDEELFEEDVIGPSNLDVSETIEQDIGRQSRDLRSLSKSSFNPIKSTKGAASQQKRQMQKEEKFMALYEDAKHRVLRKEHIYANCLDQECTFKPKLITQQSKVSKSTVREVQNFVKDKSKNMAMAMANKENVSLGESQSIIMQESMKKSSSGNLRRNDKPAVAGVPPQEFLTNSRLMYLTNRDAQSKERSLDHRLRATAKHQQSAESKVFARLAKHAEIYHNFHKQKRELQDQSTIHPKSGREMFKPQINNNFYLRDRQASGRDVTHQLHNRHKFIQEKKEKARVDAQERLNQMRNQGKASKFSEQIVMQTRRNKMGEIFDKLDNDQDGLVSTEKMDLNVLSDEMQEVFRPLFIELEQLQEPLNKEEFVDATNRLYDTLNQQQKNLILRFNKKEKKGDYQLANCTFKPQTNNLFNQALAKSSAIMQMRRPGSAHPVANTKQNAHDSRSVLSGRRDQAQANGPTLNRKAYKPPQQSQGAAFGTNLMSRLLDQGEKKKLNKDLPMYQSMHQRPGSSQIHTQSSMSNNMTNQSQMQTIQDDGRNKDMNNLINPSHYRLRSSFSQHGVSSATTQPKQNHGPNLSIQNGLQQLKGALDEVDATDAPRIMPNGPEQVAAVMEAKSQGIGNMQQEHLRSLQSSGGPGGVRARKVAEALSEQQNTEIKPVNERAIHLSQMPINLSVEQSLISETHNNTHIAQSNNESQLVMKLPDGHGQAAVTGNEFAQTLNQKVEQNIQLSHFLDRKKSLRSPQKHNFHTREQQLLQEQQLQQHLAQTAKTSVQEDMHMNTHDGRNHMGINGPQMSFNLNLEQLNASSFQNPADEQRASLCSQGAVGGQDRRLVNLGEERQKSKERKYKLTQSKSPSAQRRYVDRDLDQDNQMYQSMAQPPSHQAARSPVKISVQELLLSQTPKVVQERAGASELAPPERASRQPDAGQLSQNNSASQSNNTHTMKKRRRTQAERAEQRSMKSSIAVTDYQYNHNHNVSDDHASPDHNLLMQ